MKELFLADKVRQDLDSAKHNENTYDYYDRSARNIVAELRKLLNCWFKDYPESNQLELKSRFMKDFTSAFYELFIYHLFKSQNFEIIIHPDVKNSNKHPDFLVKRGDIEFYVEVKEFRNKSKADESFENRKNEIYNVINKIKSPNFFLCLEEIELKSVNQPSIKNFSKKMIDVMKGTNPDLLEKQIELYGIDEGRIEYEDCDLRIVLHLIPKSLPTRGLECDGSIGTYPGEAINSSANSIKQAINRKATRYGSLDKPYFICINTIGIKGDPEFDIENAIWGTLALQKIHTEKGFVHEMTRKSDGIFFDTNGPRMNNVCGLLVTKVVEFNMHEAPFWFVKNPFSSIEFDFELFDLSYSYVEQSEVKTRKNKSMAEILKLENEWTD